MNALGLEIFDKSVQLTHAWLDDVSVRIGSDRQLAWHVLGGVLRTLRDRVPVDVAAHLGAELPIMVRGLYYEQWEPLAPPPRRERLVTPQSRSLGEFLEAVHRAIANGRPVDARDASEAVFKALSHHVAPSQIERVQDTLPNDVRCFWRDGQERAFRPVI
jgi:uncharacterized protein (DUF2267 family)